MIELQNFSKSYSSKKNLNEDDFAVKNINIKVEDGSIVGLIGPNGSGKSTILKAICGIHYATSGKVVLTPNEMNNTQYNSFGYVPEIPSLPPEMTVNSFLNYAAETHGLYDENLHKSKEKIINDCSLSSFINKKIKTLSKGQKQRVSLASAIIFNPQNLILDEIISGLDPSQILQIRDLIKNLSKTKAILMSTHILQEVNSLCTKLYILNEGQIVAKGTESEILKENHINSLEECFIKLTTRSEN